LIQLIFSLNTQSLEIRVYSFNFKYEYKADKSGPSDFSIVLLIGSMNKFLKKSLSTIQLMMIVLTLSHEEGVKTVDGL
jgi:hypothetical protein